MQRPQPALRPRGVERGQGPRLEAKQLDQLRRRTPQSLGRRPAVPVERGQAVKRFRQQRREIGVTRIDCQPPTLAPRLPECRRRGADWAVRTDADSQRQPQSTQRHTLVLGLTAAFVGFRDQPRGPVHKLHGRLDLVAVLSPRAGTPQTADFAGGEQL
jgi:hypothetical protein